MVLDPKNTARTQAYQANMKKNGLRKVCTWIPDNEEAAESIKRSAKTLRKKHGTLLPKD